MKTPTWNSTCMMMRKNPFFSKRCRDHYRLWVMENQFQSANIYAQSVPRDIGCLSLQFWWRIPFNPPYLQRAVILSLARLDLFHSAQGRAEEDCSGGACPLQMIISCSSRAIFHPAGLCWACRVQEHHNAVMHIPGCRYMMIFYLLCIAKTWEMHHL